MDALSYEGDLVRIVSSSSIPAIDHGRYNHFEHHSKGPCNADFETDPSLALGKTFDL